MDAKASRGVTRFFAHVEDPRINRTRRHNLHDMILIAIVAVLGDAEAWTEVELYGQTHEPWFRKFLDLPNGIPSHDTFSRVFARIDPEQLNAGFMEWVQQLAAEVGVKTVAIDGKTLRGSEDAANGGRPLHLVSAWAHEAGLVLGQIACDAKSNEITAVPKLIGMLELEGCVVTLDAMGCQKAIAKSLVAKKADYVLTLKENQKKLHRDTIFTFAEADGNVEASSMTTHTTTDAGHGRTEQRRYDVLSLSGNNVWRIGKDAWPGIKAIGRATRSREMPDGQSTNEVRYYLLSYTPSAAEFGVTVRGHWAIENTLHWTLDVTFREDDSRVRKDHGPENFAILRRLTLNILRCNRERTKMTMRAQRRKVGWDSDFLEDLLKHVI